MYDIRRPTADGLKKRTGRASDALVPIYTPTTFTPLTLTPRAVGTRDSGTPPPRSSSREAPRRLATRHPVPGQRLAVVRLATDFTCVKSSSMLSWSSSRRRRLDRLSLCWCSPCRRTKVTTRVRVYHHPYEAL